MSTDEKINLGCLAAVAGGLIVLALIRYFILQPGGWGF
jgi:hypothetical protein